MKIVGNLVSRLLRSASSQRQDQLYFNIDEVRKFQGQREQYSAEASEVLRRDTFSRL
ncbi:MAG: hypothetical protein GX979_10830 [Firmicutes bacterium]|nr:hypothetical protein [Bacillota bacterium]